MSEYMFSIRYNRPSRKIAKRLDKICREEGGYGYTEANVIDGDAIGINNGHYQGWFTAPNQGSPFDDNLSRAVKNRCAAEHITDADMAPNQAAKSLRAIPSAARASASAANGRKGGRPKIDWRQRALDRVRNSPRLSLHETFIVADWPEGEDHWRWVVKVTIDEIISWVEAGK